VIGDALTDAHPQGSDLVVTDPHADDALTAVAHQVPVGQSGGQHVLQAVHIVTGSQAEARQVDNGIAHELSWAVVGNIAAPLHPMHLDPLSSKGVRWGQDVALVGAAPQGDDRRMF